MKQAWDSRFTVEAFHCDDGEMENMKRTPQKKNRKAILGERAA